MKCETLLSLKALEAQAAMREERPMSPDVEKIAAEMLRLGIRMVNAGNGCRAVSFKCQASDCECKCHDRIREYWERRRKHDR